MAMDETERTKVEMAQMNRTVFVEMQPSPAELEDDSVMAQYELAFSTLQSLLAGKGIKVIRNSLHPNLLVDFKNPITQQNEQRVLDSKIG